MFITSRQKRGGPSIPEKNSGGAPFCFRGAGHFLEVSYKYLKAVMRGIRLTK
jgi:hypothetical protein